MGYQDMAYQPGTCHPVAAPLGGLLLPCSRGTWAHLKQRRQQLPSRYRAPAPCAWAAVRSAHGWQRQTKPRVRWTPTSAAAEATAAPLESEQRKTSNPFVAWKAWWSVCAPERNMQAAKVQSLRTIAGADFTEVLKHARSCMGHINLASLCGRQDVAYHAGQQVPAGWRNNFHGVACWEDAMACTVLAFPPLVCADGLQVVQALAATIELAIPHFTSASIFSITSTGSTAMFYQNIRILAVRTSLQYRVHQNFAWMSAI